MAKKNPVSSYLAKIGKKGGEKKVPKGVAVLSEEERRERARQAAQARWGKRKKPKGTNS
jgi:hypothetical protein